MLEPNKETSVDKDEITVKEIVLTVQEYFNELLANWKLVFFFIVPLVLYLAYMTYSTPTKYTAELTFMLNEDEGSAGGSAMAILKQFGLGSSGQGTINLEKIVKLSTTRKIIHSLLFDSISIDGNNDLIANHIIHLQGFHKLWEESSLENLTFSHKDMSSFSREENKALKNIYNMLTGSDSDLGLISAGANKSTGIITLKVVSQSEELSLHLNKKLFKSLSEYYINKTVEKQKHTHEIVKAKVDSLKSALQSAEYRLARFKDSNRGVWNKTSYLEEKNISRDIQVLSILYGESVKNMEISDFTLRNRTPFIQTIDVPFPPLSKKKRTYLSAFILGSVLGSILFTVFVFGRKIILDSLKT